MAEKEGRIVHQVIRLSLIFFLLTVRASLFVSLVTSLVSLVSAFNCVASHLRKQLLTAAATRGPGSQGRCVMRGRGPGPAQSSAVLSLAAGANIVQEIRKKTGVLSRKIKYCTIQPTVACTARATVSAALFTGDSIAAAQSIHTTATNQHDLSQKYSNLTIFYGSLSNKTGKILPISTMINNILIGLLQRKSPMDVSMQKITSI